VLGAAGVSMMNSASAGCGFEPPAPTPTIRAPTMQQPSALRQMVYRPGSDGARFVLTSDELGRHDEPSIVGMWRFELIAPDGSTADDGYAVWHADGTEIQNSGVHAPPTSNFCLGVYERVGDRTYELNHFPLGWDASGQASAVAIQLTESKHASNRVPWSFSPSARPGIEHGEHEPISIEPQWRIQSHQ